MSPCPPCPARCRSAHGILCRRRLRDRRCAAWAFWWTVPCHRCDAYTPISNLDAALRTWRPPCGWSVVAESWAHDRDEASYRDVQRARRLRHDLAEERAAHHATATELHVRTTSERSGR